MLASLMLIAQVQAYPDNFDPTRRATAGGEIIEIATNKVVGYTIPFLGVTPKRPTEFKTNLAEQKTEGHSDTTLKVTSITTKDDNTLSTDVLGDLIVLSINPGASNAEVVSCTGLTTSTKTFTGCTFGHRFDNPTATSSGNIKAHSPGEPVVISNTDTYLSQQYLTLDGDHTIAGANTISGLWNYTNANGLCFNVTNYCIRSSGTNLQWSLNGFTDSYNFTSSTISTLTASSTGGIGILGNAIYVNVSTTEGLELETGGELGIKYNGNTLYSDSNGLGVSTDKNLTFTGNNTWSGESVFASTTLTSTTVSEFIVSATSTLATTTVTALCIGSDSCSNSTNELIDISSTTASGEMTAVNTTTAGSWDEVVSIGFQPRYVEVSYFVQGHDDTAATAQYFGMKVVAVFLGTTMQYNFVNWDPPSVAGDGLTGDNAMPNDWPAALTNSGNDPGSATAITKGSAGAGDSDISATLTINSVGSDGFTIRCTTAVGAGSASSQGRCKATWRAYR